MPKSENQAPIIPEPDRPAPKPGPQSAPADGGPVEAIASSTLFGERREITISHDDSLYRLRITRQGKLILYK